MLAAALHRSVCKELGQEVPAYVDRVYDFTKDTSLQEVQQMAPNLEKLVADLDEPTRLALFAKAPRLALWYELYTKYKDVDCFELTGRCERTATQLRAEKAQ